MSFFQAGQSILPSHWQKRGWQEKGLFVPEVEPGDRWPDSLPVSSSATAPRNQNGKRHAGTGCSNREHKSIKY